MRGKKARFQVCSVTGYVGPNGEGALASTIWYVHDSAYCFQTVAAYKFKHGGRLAAVMKAQEMNYRDRRDCRDEPEAGVDA